MQIKVRRDACCAADDQLGSLHFELELDAQTPLNCLVERIIETGFLQFSSSHTSALAYADDVAIVRIHSPYHSREKTLYLIESTTPIEVALAGGSIQFRF